MAWLVTLGSVDVAEAGPAVPMMNPYGLAFVEGCVNQYNCNFNTQHFMKAGDEFAPDYHSCNYPRYHSGPDCTATILFSADEVLSATAPQLVMMLGAEGTNVSYKADRQAIQVHGCNGTIVLNVPVPQEVQGMLAE